MKLLSAILFGLACVFVWQVGEDCLGAEKPAIDVNKLADAIFIAEGVKSNHPYGILTAYRHTSPRQACTNSILHAYKDWNGKGDFVAFLGSRYCPPNAHPLNKNWVKNVKRLFEASK